MTLQIRAIPRPAKKRARPADDQYHDITNPGNPQTIYNILQRDLICTMTLQIRAIPRLEIIISQLQLMSTMTLQIRAIPRH